MGMLCNKDRLEKGELNRTWTLDQENSAVCWNWNGL